MAACCEGAFLSSDDVLERYGRWKPPDDEKAAEKHRAEHTHHAFFDVVSSRIRDFKEFGIGHMQYFHFLRWMAALFVGLSLTVAIPQLIYNSKGRYYDSYNAGIESTTLGNYGLISRANKNDGAANMTTIDQDSVPFRRELYISAVFRNDSANHTSTAPFNKKQAIVAMSIIDCLAGIAYFLYTLALIVLSNRLSQEADTSTVTIHDYSVRVEHLPEDTTEEELETFFERYGEVVHVEMVRAYGSLLKLVVQRGETIRQLRTATAKLQKEAGIWTEVEAKLEDDVLALREKLAGIYREIQIQQSAAHNQTVVGAFITFKEEIGKVTCLAALPRSKMRQLFILKQEHKLRGIHALNVSDAPEPSDVKYENIEYGIYRQALRGSLVAFLTYMSLGAGFVLISMASALSFNLAPITNVNVQECLQTCNYTDPVTKRLSLSATNKALYSSCFTSGLRPSAIACSPTETRCYKCYCYNAIVSGSYGEALYCSGVPSIPALQISSQIVTVLSINIINYLLFYSSTWLSAFEKHHTRSSEARSLTFKLFLSQFLNSALSTVVANAYVPSVQALFDETSIGNIFFLGIYPDLTPNWYKSVGRSLVVAQFVGTALRVADTLYRYAWCKWTHHRRKRCLTQQELDEAWMGPEFVLDTRYGEHLNVIYLTMVLSGGLPIAYFSAAVWFVVCYWIDKWELVRLSRRPVAYGSDLSTMVMHLLPSAAVLHAAFSLWAFSFFGATRSPLITDGFSRFISTISRAMEPFWRQMELTGDEAAARMLQANSAHHFIVIIVMAGVLFGKGGLLAWIKAGRSLLSLAGVIEDKEEVVLSGAPEFPIAVRTQLLIGTTTYAIQEQEQYKHAFAPMDGSDDEDVVVSVGIHNQYVKGAGATGSPRAPSALEEEEMALQQELEQERLQQEAAAAAAAMAPPQPEAPPMSRLARKFRQQFRQKRVVPEVED